MTASESLLGTLWGAGGCPDETGGALWVFAYGSLMWEPSFPCAEVRPALLCGYHRSLCILSIRNRGTEARPGLVLGLDRGGSCAGRALRVAPGHHASTLAYLERREMATRSYRPKLLPVRLDGGGRVMALAFVADPGASPVRRRRCRQQRPRRWSARGAAATATPSTTCGT